MGDLIEKKEDQEQGAVPEAVLSTEEYEFVVSEAPVETEQDRLIAELKAKQAELAGKVDPVQAMKEAVAGLGQVIAPQQKPDVSVKPGINVDWSKYREEFNSKVFEDPFQMVTDLVGKAREMDAASTANQNLAYSKRIAEIDPKTAPYMNRWRDEVESEVARMSVSQRASDPNVYENAIRIVKANHLDELMDEKLKGMGAQGQGQPSRPAPFTESGRSGAPVVAAGVAPRAKVNISPAKMREIENYAEDKMIPVDQAIRQYKAAGLI